MMKKLFGYFTILVFSLFPIAATAQEDSCMPEDADVFYSDIDDELFNRGKFVGKETDEYLRAQRRARNTNWAIAIGSTAVGIATLVLVSQNHQK